MSEIRVLDSISLWNDSGSSDKVFNIQLLDMGNGRYSVDTQYGKRQNVIRESFQGRGFKCENTTLSTARTTFTTWHDKKVKGGYMKALNTPIIPVEYTKAGMGTILSKEEQSRAAEIVEGFMKFMETGTNVDTDDRDSFDILMDEF